MPHSSGPLAALAAPAPTGSAPGRPDGFLDCRGHWHSWADEESD